MEINYNNRLPRRDDILSLYEDAGWLAYTREPKILMKGIMDSLRIYSAWYGDEPVGLARVVGDGFTIIYLQDILVKKKFRRMGIGSELMRMILADYSSVRQIILLTDESTETDNFYRSLGFGPVNEINCRAYQKIKGE